MSIRRDTDSGSKKKRMNTTNNEKVLGKEAEASTSERRPSSVQKRSEGVQKMLAKLTCLEVKSMVSEMIHKINGETAKKFWKRHYRRNRLNKKERVHIW